MALDFDIESFTSDLDAIVSGNGTEKKPRRKRTVSTPTSTTTTPSINPQVRSILDRMRGGTSGQESGGSTTVVNPDSGAIGEFQVMPDNVPRWTEKHYRRRLTPEEFRNNSEAQRAVFDGEMGSYVRRALRRSKGDEDQAIRRAAAAWYGGLGAMERFDDPTPQYTKGRKYPSFRDYTGSVLNRTKGLNKPTEGFADFLRGLDEIVPAKQQVDNFKSGLETIDAPDATNPSLTATNPADPATIDDFTKGLDEILPKAAAELATRSPNEPVPETISTIESQITSAVDANSPRAAVLLTNPGQLTLLGQETIKPFVQVQTPNGLLLVNPAKAKAAGINDINSYIAQNGFSKLIGKVEDQPDTTSGIAVKTTDAQGNELSVSKVSPNAIQAQAQVDRAQFPDAANQEVVDIQDAAAQREEELRKQIVTLGGVTGEASMPPVSEPTSRTISDPTVQSEVARLSAETTPSTPASTVSQGEVNRPTQRQQRNYTEQDFKAWAKLMGVPTTPKTREKFEEDLASAGPGSVDISINPSEFKVGETPVTSEEFAPGETVGKGTREMLTGFDRTGADPNGFVYRYKPAEAATEEDAWRQALLAAPSEYNITPEKVDAFLQSGGPKYFDPRTPWKPGNGVRVPLGLLQTIGGNDAVGAFESQQAQARPFAPPNLSIDKELRDFVNTEAGRTLSATIPLLNLLPKEDQETLASTVVGEAANITNLFAGLADLAEFDTKAYESVTGKPVEGKLSDILRTSAQTAQRISSQMGAQDSGWKTYLLRMAGSTVAATPRYVLLSRMPGGISVGMAVDMGLQSRGRGETAEQNIKQFGKGFTLGSILHFAPLGGAITAGMTRRIVPEVAGTTGTAFAGSYIASKAFGDDEEQAVGNAAMGALMTLVGRGTNLFNRTVRAKNANGKSVDIYIDPEGNAKLLGKGGPKPPTEPDIEMFVDTVKQADGTYRAAGDVTPVRTPEEPISVGNRGGRIETSQEPAQLAAQNPQRIETADPAALQRVSVDTRARKIVDSLKGKDAMSADEIAKVTRYNPKNVETAIMDLYGARLIEILPDNRVRLISEQAAAKTTSLFERAKTYGQTTPEVSQPPAPVGPSSNVPTAKVPSSSEQVTGTTSPATARQGAIEEPTPTAQPNAAAPEFTPEQQTEAAQNAGLSSRQVSVEQQRRDLGRFTQDSVTYERQPEVSTPEQGGRFGRTGKVKFAENEAPDFRYRLIEADHLQPAHLNGVPNLNNFLPEAQPKARIDKASVKAADNIAGNINFAEVAENPLAYSGAPIINARGEVIQGNNRSAGIKLSYNSDDKKYKRELAANAEKFGFSPNEVEMLDRPVLVRQIDADDQEAIRLGQFDAKDVESGGTHRIEALKLSNRIPHADKGKILNDVFLNAADDATLNQLIRDNEPAIVKQLEPYLTDTQKQSLFGTDKHFTPAAVKDLEETFQHFLFSGGSNSLPGLFRELPVRAQQGLTASLPKIFGVPETASLVPEIQNAVIAVNQFEESGIPQFADWQRQPDMFTSGLAPQEIYTPAELAIAKHLIDAKTIKDVKAIFADYGKLVNGSEADLFNEAKPGVSKPEAVKELFNVEHREREISVQEPTAAEPEPARDDTVSGQRTDEETRSKSSEETEKLGQSETPQTQALKTPVDEPAEKTPEVSTGKSTNVTRPTLHGMPPQELTPLMQARVLYAKEKGTPKAEIAELFNLTPEQVESVGELPKVGTGGQMSHKLIQAMVPAKQATVAEREEKVSIVNDLAAELGLSEARLSRGTEPAEVKAASDLIRLAIAKEMGRERGSHMTADDWLKWLDAHGDRLEHDTIAAIIDAFDHQLDHARNKVEPFVQDKSLRTIVEDLHKNFGLTNIRSYRDIPREIRAKINQLGYSYGLKRTAIDRAFSQSFLDLAAEESAQTGGRRESPPDQTKVAPATPAKAGSRNPQELDDIQFSRTEPHPQTQTPEFKRWFGKSKVVDEKGQPLIVYSGHGNLEMYGDRYEPKRGTAGGFYASEDPNITSNYATGKLGNLEGYEDGSQYRFKQKNGKFGKKIWQIELTPEQQSIAREFIKSDEGGNYDLEEYWKDNRPYDADARRALARGGLRDLQSIFKFLESMGENIWYLNHEDPRPYFEKQQKSTFEKLLDKLGIEWQSYERSQPGNLPIYLKIENPLDAEKPFPPDLLAALDKKANRVRDQFSGDYTQWTKDYPMREWVDRIKDGDEYWSTQIPAKAIEVIKSFGYDGVKEVGMKGETDRAKRQINWIAFDPRQIKSAIGNRGTFDPNNPSITFTDIDTAARQSFGGGRSNVTKEIKKLMGLKNLQNTAKFGKTKDNVRLYNNPAAAALANEIVKKALGTDILFSGLHAPPKAATKIAAVAHTYGPEVAEHFKPDPVHNDLTMAINFGGEAAKYTLQEERSHRLFARSGIKKAFNDPSGLAGYRKISQRYPSFTTAGKMDEVFAKSLRDDANEELFTSKKQARANRRKLLAYLESAGVDFEEAGLADISKAGAALTRYAKRRRSQTTSEGRSGSADSGTEPTLSRLPESSQELGRRRSGRSRGFARREPDRLGNLGRGEFLETGGETRLGQRDVDLTPQEQKYLQIKTRNLPELRKDLEDEIQFARMADSDKMTIADYAIDLANVPKALKASMDLSGFRQGGITSLAHPKIAARAFVKQLTVLPPKSGAEAFERFERDLNLHPFIELAEDSGLYLATLAGEAIGEREEQFMSRLLGENRFFRNNKFEAARKLATFGVRASERAFKTFLDDLRINTFATLARALHNSNVRTGREDTPEQYQGLARFINYATGRGDLGKFNDAAPYLNAAFFSARYWMSRLQVMNPFFYAKLPPGVRGLVVKDLLKSLGAMALVGALLKLAGGKIEYDDPNDPDTLKVGFGNYSYDITFGLIKHLRYAARMLMATQEKNPADKMTYLTERYVRSSASPIAGGFWSGLSGKNYAGEPTNFKQEAAGLFTPIMIDNFADAAKQDGTIGLIKMSPEFFGISTTRYKEESELKQHIDQERENLKNAKTLAEKEEAVRRLKAWSSLLRRQKKYEAEDRLKLAKQD